MLLYSCKPKEEEHLSPEKMQHILTDLHLAEINSMLVYDSTHQARNKNIDSLALYYNEVFAHHRISKEEFSKSLEWYKANPQELDSVYARVITDLSIMSGETEKK
jgi:hypothetical protein